MREIKTCILDLDGVICDTARYHFLAWKVLAERLGITFTETDNERLKGVSRMESLDILLGLKHSGSGDSIGVGENPESPALPGQTSGTIYTKAQKLAFAEEKNAVYVEFIRGMNQDELLPGVLDFLSYCRARGIKTALGSVSRNAGLILDRLNLRDYFDAVIDGTKITRAKPDPEVFLKGAVATGADPSQCVVFEDARAGIEAAKRAGMAAIGIGTKEALSNADFIIDGFDAMEAKALLETAEKI